jgi:SNF2 family DNA or RNA helicase
MYCDHPDLLRQSKSEQIKNFSIKATESSKLNELKNIVEEIVSSGNKVIIFTQYVKMMEIIEREIPDVLLYYGGMSEKQRNEAIRLFTETNDYFVLCSTDAGAHGLNLQNAASYMINYDLPWNPSKLNQRIDRIHRMGQSNVVNIINLVISNYTTIEERVVKILNKKQRMFEKLIEGE